MWHLHEPLVMVVNQRCEKLNLMSLICKNAFEREFMHIQVLAVSLISLPP